MLALMRRCTLFFLFLAPLTFLDLTILAEDCDARASSGGRSSGSRQRQSPAMNQQRQQQATPQQQQSGGFGRGFLGGLAGGAIGAMLFGSLLGAGGTGVGFLLPLIILGIVGFFAYRMFVKRPRANAGGANFSSQRNSVSDFGAAGKFDQSAPPPIPPIPPIRDAEGYPLEEGLAQIRRTDPGFDEKYFLDVASDVFFQVQAGWTRRDIAPFRHLLSEQLAAEYEQEFAKMRREGVLSKLESIAIRKVEIVDAGMENDKDFASVRFTANLLDYKVDEKSGAIVEGSNTVPVKFVEDWIWERPIHTEDWKLAGIQIVEG